MSESREDVTIRIWSLGNLGNRMFQYMAGLSLQERIPGSRLANVVLPEWDIMIADIEEEADPEFTCVVTEYDVPDLDALADRANRGELRRIDLSHYMQNLRYLHAPEHYRTVFVNREDVQPDFGSSDLIINVRSGELMTGLYQYPLVPVGFYRDIAERTGLNPVLTGQLQDNSYTEALRRAFPSARFIPSQGPMRDFEMVRQAPNVVVSVSTFSFLAAWLSRAERIVLPLHGFLNPARFRAIDLLPSDDPRFRFFLFPLTNGVLDAEAHELHRRLEGTWREISAKRVAHLRLGIPDNRPPPPRELDFAFDETWYLHRYLDAAMEVSEGRFADARHHFYAAGRALGYAPVPVEPPAAENVARGKPANQSSLSHWSRFATTEEDAAGAVDGTITGGAGFHTAEETNPWWQVDLGALYDISRINVHNRTEHEVVAARALPLVAQVSDDALLWKVLGRRTEVIDKMDKPWTITPRLPVRARFVRLTIPREECLHLDEVEVFGVTAE